LNLSAYRLKVAFPNELSASGPDTFLPLHLNHHAKQIFDQTALGAGAGEA
jgi:hypothetical protein